MALVLVLNSGSSSIKFQLVDPTQHATDAPFASGLVEQIGEPKGKITLKHGGEKYVVEAPIADHTAGLDLAFKLMGEHGCGPKDVELEAVGHRVVHGGQVFSQPELITDEVVEAIRGLIPLAPLHNPANISGIEVARTLLPELPHVAVFDTGFFYSMPPASALYAIESETATKNGVRRYGFHGTSHEYISQQVPKLLGKDPEDVNQITLHLGNGASAAAIRQGNPIDTSMGMTPLAGLAMGTRSGDIDPGIIFHLYRTAGMSIDEIDDLLNKRSGVKGISGVNDFRELHQLIAEGNEDARLAYKVYIQQLRRFIGSYMISLGRIDAITFTAGVGENDDAVRADALADLENFGIKIDLEANAVRADGAREISTPDSTIKVFVVPTNEELAIARYAKTIAESV
ncbi:acetate kinase [Corynebacterium pseudotuberculosis]|uniref:Acetate kinase n=2 Tax=Corynebacterium pseudotuberculosis TaxID=1719 RepID=D9QCK4_CORP2|nr:acetate kinase [Corynebacterium pseudotuberculosis]AER69840.1 Acetate kinase [Corynebacterium pseudotuberculosis 1/06-A]ADK29623.1 acetate/propionate family kinase [Corynebacterium pseudotuberculosis FRC41]ADL11280.1 acetate/propionate family kinase [Corynebacterium pseudotuberculosis C231]ADL21694.1 acetate kinase [Corynebacterium pseudotuberculosis 1002]ADO27091.1 acetate/propionate family kinase [Corynebacterium pseudotuberculosis I19]